MNGNIPPALFTDLDQPETYEVLTGILGFGPSRSNELIDMSQRSGGIHDSGVLVIQSPGCDTWTIVREA